MREEILNKKIAQTKEEIETANIMVEFLRWMAEGEADKEKAATYNVKADQMEVSKKINEKFIEFTETL